MAACPRLPGPPSPLGVPRHPPQGQHLLCLLPPPPGDTAGPGGGPEGRKVPVQGFAKPGLLSLLPTWGQPAHNTTYPCPKSCARQYLPSAALPWQHYRLHSSSIARRVALSVPASSSSESSFPDPPAWEKSTSVGEGGRAESEVGRDPAPPVHGAVWSGEGCTTPVPARSGDQQPHPGARGHQPGTQTHDFRAKGFVWGGLVEIANRGRKEVSSFAPPPPCLCQRLLRNSFCRKG